MAGNLTIRTVAGRPRSVAFGADAPARFTGRCANRVHRPRAGTLRARPRARFHAVLHAQSQRHGAGPFDRERHHRSARRHRFAKSAISTPARAAAHGAHFIRAFAGEERDAHSKEKETENTAAMLSRRNDMGKILIVDDEDDVRLSLERRLKREDLRCQTAGSQAEAIAENSGARIRL